MHQDGRTKLTRPTLWKALKKVCSPAILCKFSITKVSSHLRASHEASSQDSASIPQKSSEQTEGTQKAGNNCYFCEGRSKAINLRGTYVRKRKELRMQLARCTGAVAAENVRRRAENWSYWKVLNFLDPVIDTGVRYNVDNDNDIEALQEDDSPTTSQSCRPNAERQKSRRTNALIEGLTSALKQTEDEQLDRFDVACTNLAHSLRAVAELNATRGGYWKLRVEELQLEISEEELKLKMEGSLQQ